MATEEGIVIKTGNAGSRTVWVRTTRSSACESCTSKHACHETGNAREMEVEALNTAGARVGDRIVLALNTGSLLKATFLLYVFPILALIAGALTGQVLAGPRGWDPSASAALIGFLFFGLAFGFIRIISRWLAGDSRYQPEIVKIRQRDGAHIDAAVMPGADA